MVWTPVVRFRLPNMDTENAGLTYHNNILYNQSKHVNSKVYRNYKMYLNSALVPAQGEIFVTVCKLTHLLAIKKVTRFF